MSDIGYRNRSQAAVAVSVNSLEEYMRDLRQRDHEPVAAVPGARRQGRR